MTVDTDPNLAYIEHDFVRAMNGETPLAATSFDELERLATARGLLHFAAKIRKRDYRYIRYTVLEKLKEYRQEDNLVLLHPDWA